MPASQERQPTLDSVAPRFLVGDMEQALAFYGQLGFATPYHDEGFAIIERDGIALQFNVSDPTQEPPKEGCRVCYIGVTNIEALYQQYLPTWQWYIKTVGPFSPPTSRCCKELHQFPPRCFFR